MAGKLNVGYRHIHLPSHRKQKNNCRKNLTAKSRAIEVRLFCHSTADSRVLYSRSLTSKASYQKLYFKYLSIQPLICENNNGLPLVSQVTISSSPSLIPHSP